MASWGCRKPPPLRQQGPFSVGRSRHENTTGGYYLSFCRLICLGFGYMKTLYSGVFGPHKVDYRVARVCQHTGRNSATTPFAVDVHGLRHPCGQGYRCASAQYSSARRTPHGVCCVREESRSPRRLSHRILPNSAKHLPTSNRSPSR